MALLRAALLIFASRLALAAPGLRGSPDWPSSAAAEFSDGEDLSDSAGLDLPDNTGLDLAFGFGRADNSSSEGPDASHNESAAFPGGPDGAGNASSELSDSPGLSDNPRFGWTDNAGSELPFSKGNASSEPSGGLDWTGSASAELPDGLDRTGNASFELSDGLDWTGSASAELSELSDSLDWAGDASAELLEGLNGTGDAVELAETALLGATSGAAVGVEAGDVTGLDSASAWWGHHHHHHRRRHHHHGGQDPAPTPGHSGGHIRTLYHETSPEIAEKILAGGFRPGRSGWCGGAIYFFGSPRVPRSKLGPDSHSGAVIEAKVDLGRMAHLDRRCHGASSARRHYDSITFNPGDGDEYIIFSSSRVLSTRRYK